MAIAQLKQSAASHAGCSIGTDAEDSCPMHAACALTWLLDLLLLLKTLPTS